MLRKQKDDAAAVWKAAKRGDADAIDKILRHHARVGHTNHQDAFALLNTCHPKRGTTPLMVAVRYNHVECVRALLALGAEVNQYDQTKHGNTALHYAAYHNQIVCMEVLLTVDVNTAFLLNRYGHSPLDLARFRNHWQAAQHLMVCANLHVHSDWLYLKPTCKLGWLWKKRWCVVLANNPDKTRLELAIYKKPSDVRPKAIVLLKMGAEAIDMAPHDDRNQTATSYLQLPTTWSERPFQFQLQDPIAVFTAPHQDFSRDPIVVKTLGSGQADHSMAMILTQFAAESAQARAVWLAKLNCPSVDLSMSCIGHNVCPNNHAERQSVVEFLFAEAPLRASISSATSRLSLTSLESLGSTPVDARPPIHPMPSAPSLTSSQMEVEEQFLRVRGDCLICMDAPKDAACIPCGHVAGCFACMQSHVAALDQTCPICRLHVDVVIKLYDC